MSDEETQRGKKPESTDRVICWSHDSWVRVGLDLVPKWKIRLRENALETIIICSFIVQNKTTFQATFAQFWPRHLHIF